MNTKKANIISLILTFIVAVILYYFFLPAINLQSFGFWAYLLIITFIFSFMTMIASIDERGTIKKFFKTTVFGFSFFFTIMILILLVNIFMSPLFNSKSYANRITINEDGNFTQDIKSIDFDKIPLLDKSSSQKLGDRVMGQLPEMVSQFYVSDLYTQINYNDSIVRVTPLEYNGFFKYLNNHKDGVNGYIMVNSVSGESKLIKLDKGMKYMPSAILNEDLLRHLRFSYPTDIFGTYTFEIDNDGNPYWIVPVMKFSGVGLKKEVKAIIIMDPITGDSNKYKVDDVPSWVDHVYSAELVIEQVDDWGRYKNGFFNSIFGQKNVVMTTEGYNYTIMDDDVYMYTGITSAASDEANIGFIMTNLRTKQTSFYSVPGAEEYSAMASAEGQVQQMGYSATFPLLINLNQKPTYLISLKDNAGLVKMYSFVDVTDYQKVVVTDASEGIEKAASNYLGNDEINITDDMIEKTITVSKINLVNIDGTTYYYIIDSDNQKYRASIKVDKDILGFLREGDILKIKYTEDKPIIDILKVE